MSKRHLKTIAAPKSWPIKRKEKTWITRSNPGPHKLSESLPLSLVLKLLKYTKTTKETKQVLNQSLILVNNKVVKDPKFPVGLFDVVSFKNKEYFRLFYTKRGKLILIKIPNGEETLLPYKIINKTLLKNKKIQLNFHNGFNLLVDKDNYKTNDVLLLENKNNKVKEHFKFEKGALVYITKGKHLSETAKVDTLYEKPPLNKHVLLDLNGKKMSLPKSYVFVIGKTKPLFTFKNE